jgi:ABC-2 type transport system permease protein
MSASLTNSTTVLASPPRSAGAAPSSARTLRKLFLTLFLRGQSLRGLKKNAAPKSVGQKLAMTMFFYGMFGCIVFMLVRQPVFFLSAYLHAMTFAFVGMFVAASAGEVLFNQAEADILLHRPIEPRTLLWAKVWVLVEVSLWIAGAFNLAGLIVGVLVPNGSWLFPLVHAGSTVLLALFCVSCVVVVYQLCLRWFGRERLEAIMVLAQVVVSVGAVLGGQLLPQMLASEGQLTHVAESAWWIGLVPPAWFAGIDDALAGSGARSSWLLAACAILATALVLWLAFGKLANTYEAGLQTLNESAGAVKQKQRGRWIGWLVNQPPLSWWLRDPVERASFLLTVAYLVRDRDVKLRVYPGLAPFLVLPVIFLFGGRGGATDSHTFGIAISCGYLSLVPMLAASMMSYSQHWQASDLFRVAPLTGPGRLCHGARQAVLFVLALPMSVALGVTSWAMVGMSSQCLLLLPGLIALPVFALIPSLDGQAVPLSRPGDEAKAASRGLSMIGIMMLALAIGGLGLGAWHTGVFWWFVLAELLVAGGAYFAMCRVIARSRWTSAE